MKAIVYTEQDLRKSKFFATNLHEFHGFLIFFALIRVNSRLILGRSLSIA